MSVSASSTGVHRVFCEHCVEYIIHVIDVELKKPATVRTRLSDILKRSIQLKKDLLKDYIWQRDAFELKFYPDALAESAKTPHLKGRTDFGDSIADEWLVVFLLRELSKQFQDAWIRVYDTDGEFLRHATLAILGLLVSDQVLWLLVDRMSCISPLHIIIRRIIVMVRTVQWFGSCFMDLQPHIFRRTSETNSPGLH